MNLHGLNARLLPRRLLYPPEWLVLGVNTVCNLHCRMCDVGQGVTDTNFARNLLGASPTNMPFELMETIVDQAARHFPSTRLGYAFTEPLTYPHLERSVALARDRGLTTAVTTNALTLPARAEGLAAAGLDDLFVSLDGPADVHDQIRGRDGSFERARRGMEILAELDPRPRMSVYCVLTPWNQGRLADFLGELAHLPLERVGFMHPNFTTEEMARTHNLRFGDRYPATVSNLEPFDTADMDLEALAAELADLARRSWPFPLAWTPPIFSAAELERYYRAPHPILGRRCNDAFRTLMIKADGTVIPAHGRCYDLTVGNLHEDSLVEIWNSPELGRFRATLIREGGLLPACARCCSAF